jgi:uncharacterized repeat protein (TIGR01451 family)
MTYIGIARCAALLWLLLLDAAGAARGQATGPSLWPTLYGSASRAAATVTPGPGRPSLFWKLSYVQYVNVLFRSPVATRDGALVTSLFASTPNRGSEARLVRARPDGPSRLLAQVAMLGDPAIGPDGSLYVLAVDEEGYKLILLSEDEKAEKVPLPSGRPAFNSPAVAKDGSVFLALNGLVLGMSEKGELRWVWAHPQLGDPTRPQPVVIDSPAIGPDGTLYAVFQDAVYAFAPADGALVWRSSYQFVDADRPVGGPVVAPDGTLYLTTQAPPPPEGGEGEAFLYALRRDGALGWRWPAGRGAPRHPAVGPDGTVYLPVTGLRRPDESVVGRLYVLNPDSSLRRPPLERAEEQGMIEAVVLDGAGTLYALAPQEGETVVLGLRPDGSDLFPPTPVPGRLVGPVGIPRVGAVSALTDRGMVLLADGPVLDLVMAVEAIPAPPKTLAFTIRIRNTGILPATNLLIRSAVPDITQYVAGSAVLNGRPVADLGDGAPVQNGVNLGLLAPGAEAALTFRVTIRPSFNTVTVTNNATARSDQLGTLTSNTVTFRAP